MKKYLILLLFPINSLACTGYVIGFAGLNDVFDKKAFSEYATKINYCARSYSWQQGDKARDFIESLQVPYQLYGFSKGAETVAKLLNTGIKTPEYVTTIGAYKTVDLDFTKYHVPFANYFDDSGTGQRSPGIFLDVPHIKMQATVNKLIGK
jgi:hypothetical protein